ncbi:hypothetical protein SS50377_28317 [Spironucleus salmonicida]|uniref:Uncharacterized protein n=1 Tax=Spironucleus salmonicida TaxID=348837 RepID=V6LSY0_9EUKA|nr:hypothetical protein SS50377_28317 [Spironucleus salmonicida]|eukprot:EST47363.1 hypothetical protein SS50377_12571 [Spironucleus salmonicida]
MFGKVRSLKEIFPFTIDVQNETYVQIVSKEGNKNYISKRAAIQCPIFKQKQQDIYHLDYSNKIVKIFIQYLYYKLRYSAPVVGKGVDISPFNDIQPELAPIIAMLALEMQV